MPILAVVPILRAQSYMGRQVKKSSKITPTVLWNIIVLILKYLILCVGKYTRLPHGEQRTWTCSLHADRSDEVTPCQPAVTQPCKASSLQPGFKPVTQPAEPTIKRAPESLLTIPASASSKSG